VHAAEPAAPVAGRRQAPYARRRLTGAGIGVARGRPSGHSSATPRGTAAGGRRECPSAGGAVLYRVTSLSP